MARLSCGERAQCSLSSSAPHGAFAQIFFCGQPLHVPGRIRAAAGQGFDVIYVITRAGAAAPPRAGARIVAHELCAHARVAFVFFGLAFFRPDLQQLRRRTGRGRSAGAMAACHGFAAVAMRPQSATVRREHERGEDEGNGEGDFFHLSGCLCKTCWRGLEHTARSKSAMATLLRGARFQSSAKMFGSSCSMSSQMSEGSTSIHKSTSGE